VIIEDLTTLELHTILRCLRSAKQTLEDSWNLLEAKREAMGDGDTDQALLAVENNLYVVNTALRKIWITYTKATRRRIGAPEGEPPQQPSTPPKPPSRKK